MILLQPSQTALYGQLDMFSPANDDHEDILDSLSGHAHIARPASPDFAALRDDNPIDPQYLLRAERLRREEIGADRPGGGEMGSAGTHSVTWAIGG